jgi:DNA-binding MarR family transcriptional regulator
VDIKNKTFYLLSATQHLMENHLKKEFARNRLSITPSHCPVLFILLDQGPQAMNKLSEITHLENATITGLIDRMESKGLVSRSFDPSDRRKIIVTITARGVEEIQKGKKSYKKSTSKLRNNATIMRSNRLTISFINSIKNSVPDDIFQEEQTC